MNFKMNECKQGKVPALNLLAFCLLLSLIIIFSGLFHRLDNWLTDSWFNLRIDYQGSETKGFFARFFPKSGSSEKIVLVVIDDNSILSIPGLFQGDRSVFAKALNNLKDVQTKVIALDVFFPSPDYENPDGDEELLEAISALKNVVVKAYRRDNRRMPPPFPKLARCTSYAPTYYTNSGDDAIRKVSMFFESEADKLTSSFQLEILKKFLNLQGDYWELSNDNIVLKVPDDPFVYPLTDQEFMQLNYDRSLYSFKTLSFADLYSGLADPELFRDKIVIIGFGNSMTEERYYTPIGSKIFSPFLNALAITNLINKNGLKVTSQIANYTFAAICLAFFLFLFPLLPSPVTVLFSVILIALSIFASLITLMFYKLQIGVSATIFAIFSAMIHTLARRYHSTHSEKLRIKTAFQHYVTPSVVNEILKNPEKLNLHGEERDLTIFFSDIEGFTALSEGMSPLDVVSLLNEYLSEMTEVIFNFEGLLDKYEGDAIMAVFGAPVDQKDHAIRACRCAIQNQIGLSKLRQKWQKEGKPQFRARIGINTGNVVVGNMGSKMRFDYTVIGDNVNLAARLETANKIMDTEILVSESTASLAEEVIISRCLGKLKVAGKTKHVRVFEILADRKSSDEKTIKKAETLKYNFEKAFQLFSNREFAEAKALLEEHLKMFQEDKPAKMLLEKVEGFLIIAPPPDWEDIITQEAK